MVVTLHCWSLYEPTYPTEPTQSIKIKQIFLNVASYAGNPFLAIHFKFYQFVFSEAITTLLHLFFI